MDSGTQGAIVIDLYDQGFQGLGIGLGNCDTIRLTYDYCMLCPAPLNGVLDYELLADWCYIGGLPSECAISTMTIFGNGTTIAPSATIVDELVAAGFPAVHNTNYYNLLNLDTLFCKLDDTQGVVFVNDSEVEPGIPLSAANVDGSDLIAAGSPGSSIEIKEVEFCNPDPKDATGFSGYVTTPNAVMFQGVCLDAAGTMPLVTTLISDDGQIKKYQVDFPSTTLSSGDCISAFVKTTLLFCPLPGSLPPEICVGASSGCSPDEVRAAIGGGGACASSEVCYAYIFGEADLQTEWFSFPDGIDLCETFTLHVRTKNVKDLVLLNMEPNFTLPFGLSVIPGSWEVAYPGGTVDMTGNFGAWTGVPDPDLVNGLNYAWSDDVLWSSHIDMFGLPGVSVTQDSNTVSFRFEVTTNCDEFLSGSKPNTESLASDPCGPDALSSGNVEAPALIVNGADPADHAQILAVGSPSELYCGGLMNEFGLTALNVSDNPTTDSVVTCIIIPGEYLDYSPGSVMFTNGFVPDYITETPLGNDIQVCVHSPVLPPGQSWSLTFEAAMKEDAPCGQIPIAADIKSVVEAVSCNPGPPDECAVFVQNSLNPVILIDLEAPLETTDVRVSADCVASEDPVQVCYEIDLSNPGPTYDGNVRVGIHDDVTANGALDSFDPELNGMDHAVSLAPGETTTVMMCLDIAAIQSCPIIIKQTYETDCACDSEETPIMDLSPSFIADLQECVVLCPTQPLMLETCGDYEITLDPAAGGTITDDGMGMLSIELASGFGIPGTDPVKLVVTGGTGECEIMDMVDLKSIGDWVAEDQVADICAEDCVDLDLMIPAELEDGATITWSPTLGLDDPTSATPEVCDLTADQVYDVEIKFSDDCVFNIEYAVTYNPNGVTTITGEEFCLCQEAGTLTGLSGFESYEWYSIQSGAEILEFIGTTNTWNGPTVAGDYFLKAFLPGAICPSVSNVVTLDGKECVDLELEKNIINIPSPVVIGSQITYEIEVCNIADDALGLKFDATNVEISDELPGAVTYVQHTQTTGNYSPTTNQWDISTLASGTCETLLIDVTIDAMGMIENTAQISGSDQEDIDSEENNDDGDQSEDDEDNAVIEVVCESLGGEIFYDDDNNGCQDPGEGLVMETINVTLYECGDMPGVDPPAATTQVMNGEYEFGPESDDIGADVCLQPDTEYFVVFDIPNNANEPLEDYSFSDMMPDASCPDGNGTDTNPNTGATDCEGPGSGDGDDDNHMDAGIMPPCYEMAGEIFYDTNNDGCQDPGEGLVDDAPIEVSIYECGDIPGVDQPAATTTVTDGMYEFGEDSDDPGADICLENDTEYFVVFDIPNAVGEALEEFEFSSNDASGACAVSGESDNVDPATGASGCFDPDDDDGSDGDDDQNVDAGITPPCETLGGEIFYDTNGNGCEDGTESLVMEPINVMLFECGDDPSVDPPAASTTVSDGEYEFGPDSDDPGAEICLMPGTEYFVVFDIPMGAGEVLDGYEFTAGMASASCDAAGEGDDVDPATGMSDCFDPNDDDATDGDDDNSVDAGITPPCESISGEIFYDYDDNGCQDAMEPLVMNDVNVSLYECGDTPGVDAPAAATTVNDGEYMFGEGSDDPGADICLEAGTEYFVVFDIPNAPGEDLEGFDFSTGTADPACALSGEADDIDPATGASGCVDPDDADGGDGDSDNNVDAGITPQCESLGGEIFYDDDRDGCQDGNESLVMEIVGVMLYECGQTPGVDTPTASTFTNDGEYEFGEDSDDPGADVCLMPGTQYFVVFDLPNAGGESLEDYEFTMGMADAGCMALGESSDVDPATGQTDCQDPNDNDSGDGDGDNNMDAGITPPCESISGEIFYDDNRDGCEDPGETLVMENIEVSIYECGDTPGVDQPLASTTVSDGEYEFGVDSDDMGADICLEAGTDYFVVFDIPNAAGEALEDFSITEGVASGACATSGESNNADPATGATGCVDPDDNDGADGDDDENLDAGITPPCETLGGEIFYDGDEDGCQDPNEMLVMEAIDVMLYECGDVPGVDAPAASTTVTDGEYEFGPDSEDPGAEICLEPDTEYFVVFEIPNAIGEALEEFEFTSGMADAACMAAGDSSDVDPATGATDCENPGDSDGDGDDNMDAGIVPPCEQIGGEIFYDLDDNGCQDTGESLVMENINVSLYECGDDPAVDFPVASTTVSDGMYAFGETSDDPGADVCLEAGTEYFVVFDIPSAPGDPLEDFEFSSAPLDPGCAATGDSDDVNPTTGASGCHDPNNDDTDDGDSDENIDAGIVPPCEELAGEIFIDEDENGCQDPGESLVMTNVTVSLYECGDVPGVDTPTAITTVTDGEYEFGENSDDAGADICLPPNVEYFVHFDIPNGAGENLEDYAFSMGMADAACEAAGQSNDVDPATGDSECFDPSEDGGDENVDAGITPPCESLGGEIFVDENRDGCEDSNESLALFDIEVSLYECGDVPGVDQPLASTIVSDGEYEFGEDSDDAGADICLDAGTEYFVAFDLPNGPGEALEDYEFTPGVASGACAIAGDSDNVDPATGTSSCFDPDDSDDGDGDDDNNIDAGISPPCETLGGEIFYDDNANGCQDGGESLVMESINVMLFECGQTPGVDAPVASTNVADGMYEFGEDSDDPGADVCLSSDIEYFVVFDIPMGANEVLDGFEFTDGMASATCMGSGQSDDVDPTTGTSGCYDPGDDDANGDSDDNIDAGITAPCERISGEIFYDTNGNGCEDGTESLVMEDIGVSLYECGDTPGVDQPAASTTVSDGEYEFGIDSDDPGADICLDANTEYFVVFDIPNGVGEALEDYGFTDGTADAACELAGESDNVDPTTGATACVNPSDDDSGDGDDDENLDAGIMPPCESMAGEIFYDDNGNGCQDGGESLVMEAINVSVYECGDTPGTDAPVASTSVNDGEYMFGMGSDDPGAEVCLDAGTEYFVVFDIPMGAGEVLDGFEFTEGMASPACETAGGSDDVDPTTGYSDCYDPNNEDGADGDSDENIDAGITPPCESLGGEIFYDDNNDGCQDPNEPLVNDQTIEVVLYECGDIPGLDQPAAFTSTSDGMYEFGIDSDDPGADICLEAGTEYFVEFHIPNGPGEALEDYYFSENTAAPSCLFSGEGDNIDPNTGQSSCHDPSDTDGRDGDADENIDAGIMHPCEILGGAIFYDYDNDGCHDATESLVTDPVNVSVYECGDDPATAAPVASTTTTDGTYQFGDEYSVDSTDDPCLNPRLEYFVVFDFPSAVGDPLEDHYFSDGEGDGAGDGDVCAGTDSSDDVDSDTGVSDCYGPDNDDDDNDIDAGITPCEEISGEVYYDWNANGCQDDAAETGVEGVDVHIFECGETDLSPANALGTSTTNADGEYAFGPEEEGTAEVCLHPDIEYFVLFDIPNGDGEQHEDFFVTDGDSASCAGDDTSDDTDPTTATTDCHDPDDDDDDSSLDAGITPCENISGEVFFDNNADGCQDEATEGPVVGMNVYIFECGETDTSPANALASDVTDADGEYEFGPEEEGDANVCLDPAMSYFVLFDVPTADGETYDDFALTDGDGSSCTGADNMSDVDPATGTSDCYGPDEDDDDSNVDAGIMPCEELAGEVFFDNDQDGCHDPANELGVPGVDVYLFECGETDTSPGNALASDTTDDDGEYKFGSGEDGDADFCLVAGAEYFVVFDLPNAAGESLDGAEFTEGDSSSCAGADSANDANQMTGASDCYDPQDDDSGDVDAGITTPIDVALLKDIVTPGPYSYGQTVTFEIEVFNQGAEALHNIKVNDFIPCGYEYLASNDTVWTFDSSQSIATTTIVGPITGGMSEVLSIDVVVQPCDPASVDGYTNVAEVESFQDEDGNDITDEDIDSTGDNDPTNDTTVDGDKDNKDGDEDDNDPATIEIFDLALQKTVSLPDPLVALGDTIEYWITVYNQGNIIAEKIEVTDYLNAPLLFDPSLNTGWSQGATNLTYIEDGPLNPGDSAHIQLNLIIDPAAAGTIEVLNFAEISGSLDDEGNDRSDDDVDSDADDNAFNDPGGVPGGDSDGMIMENGFDTDGDGIADEDDHDPVLLVLLTCHEFACIGNINLSLDNNCTSEITAAMLLAEESANAPSLYEIVITNDDGDVVDNQFDFTDLGNCFNVSVSLPDCNMNSCWSRVCIEDKFAPALDCGMPQEVFACSAAAADLSAVTPPVIMDNCGGAELVLLNEVIDVNNDCDPDNLLATVTRSYKAVDSQGNESQICNQVINVLRVASGTVTFPAAFTSDVCTTSTDVSVTGVPTIDGVSIFPVNQSETCNLMVSFQDIPLGADNCHNKFVRNWTVREWWCGSVVDALTFGQIIEINDLSPPSITCPADMTVTTDGGIDNCIATFMLPPATVTDDCNTPVEVDIITGGPFIDGNGGQASLEVGTHEITYVAYDGCENSSTCTMMVTVMDNTQPTVLCDGNTVVSLQNDGMVEVFAEVFDDGSFDDCAIDRFEVRRMDLTTFGPSVSFDCTDIGQELLVVFRVFDMSGNFNDCMVNVEVQDKTAATITCLDNVVLECPAIFDVNNLALQFGMPEIMDDCADNLVVDEIAPIVEIDNCGLGRIVRRFRAPDGVGGTLSCNQVIRVVNNSPFTDADIIFPLDFETTSMCDFEDATPDNLPAGFNFPVISEDACDLVGVDFEDQTFNFASDPTACFKILRTWTVIDWCQRAADGTFLTWSHVQEIKINNETDPEIQSGLMNIVVESIAVDCGDAFVTLGITATDDCPMNIPLSYFYEIDLDSDGTTDLAGNTSDASGDYPIGVHTIHWLVLDGCGNEDQGSHTFEVRNIKAPVAICLQGLSVNLTLMDTDGDNIPDTNMAILWASDFDKGSSHPCGYPVTLSVSADINETNIVFDCDDVGQQGVQLWVTDIFGNQSFCSTFVDVQDNDNLCPDNGGMTTIGGRVFTEEDESVEEVEVELIGSGAQDMTEEDGLYDFVDMPLGGEYTIDPGKDNDVLNGVSTLDLVLIQKHILQTQLLNSPYKHIAADINHDENITAIDLIQLRKLILGVYEEYPSNESWRFVNALYEFAPDVNPLDLSFPEAYGIDELEGSMWINFIGIKIGDVNGSVVPNLRAEVADRRSDKTLNLGYEDVILEEGIVEVVISSENFNNISGMQFTLEHKGLSIDKVEAGLLSIAESNVAELEEGVSTMSWNRTDGESMTIANKKNLFTLTLEVGEEQVGQRLSEILTLTSTVTRAEAYEQIVEEARETRYEEIGVSLDPINTIAQEKASAHMVMHQNEPNPWNKSTMIKVEVDADQEGRIIIKDLTGRLIHSKKVTLEQGMNEIMLTEDLIPVSGVYNYSLVIDDQQVTKQMIRL